MAVLWTTRISFPSLLVHLVSGNLVGNIEERGESSGHQPLAVLDIIWSMCVSYLCQEIWFNSGFNGDDFGCGAMVFMGTCTKAFRLLSAKSDRLW
jgi:hypothetical protein